MKKILAIILLTTSNIACSTVGSSKSIEPSPVEQKTIPTEKVCIMSWDSVKSKHIKKCRPLKIHKKLEGNPVPS
jgi:hypothetical protein